MTPSAATGSSSLLNTIRGSVLTSAASGHSDPDRVFADLLGRSTRPVHDGRTDESRAREAAEQFVAITFVQPLLKQLRETNSASPPFAPSQAERQFQSLADQATADRIVRSSRWPLVDRIAADLIKRSNIRPVVA
ncbi:MAG: hypothetical protein KF768_05100 [Phycisphaeraceae bacterium]|nr:hypothetical protein [Phycisphaeraceae bacterium]